MSIVVGVVLLLMMIVRIGLLALGRGGGLLALRGTNVGGGGSCCCCIDGDVDDVILADE